MSHRVESPELEELAATFALEAQPPEERVAYLGHLEVCDVCRRLASQFQATADLLPSALEEQPGSPSLKGRILAEAAADLPGQNRRAHELPSRERLPLRWLWPGWISPRAAAAMAVLILAIVGVGTWNVILWGQVNQRDETLVAQEQILDAIAAGARISPLAGTEAAPQANATLIQEPGASSAFLLVNGLPALPEGQEYQVWKITGEDPAGAGIFGRSDSMEQLVILPTDFFGADAIGVSIEPRGGSPQPTGAIVLQGELCY